MKENAKVLREQIAKRQVRVDVGTIVRFKSHSVTTGITYWYGAIFVAGKWWLTSAKNYFGKQCFSTDEFLDLVARGVITDVDVATEFEPIK